MLVRVSEMNWLTAKADVRVRPDASLGSFAAEPIRAGDTIAAYGGYVVTREGLDVLPAERQGRSIQIDDHLYLVSAPSPERGDTMNHCCDPNCGLRGSTLIVAMRDIQPG